MLLINHSLLLQANVRDTEYLLNDTADHLVAQLRAHLAGSKHCETKTISMPATWFDHFKVDFKDHWLVKMLVGNRLWKPPAYKVISIPVGTTYVCPHLPTDNKEQHFRFAAAGTPVIDDLEEYRLMKPLVQAAIDFEAGRLELVRFELAVLHYQRAMRTMRLGLEYRDDMIQL